MKVHHTLICFFLLTLQDGNTGLINAETIIQTGTEGGNITLKCSFYFSGSRKMFCKDKCKEGNILIETTNDRAQSGRYSIEYKEGSFPSTSTVLYVNITQLNKSDSGRYRCGLDRKWFLDAYMKFELIVTEASSSKPNSTLQPVTTSVPSTSTSPPPQSLSSSPGSFTPSSSSNETTKHPETESSAGSVNPTTDSLLYTTLTLVVMIIILSVAVLIFCRKRPRKHKEHPVETAYDIIREDIRVYEEIREDGQSTSRPVEVSTVYTCAKYTKPNGAETTDEYSLVTATATCAQNQTEDNSSKLIYSEVDFLNGAAASLHSAPCGNTDYVIYSEPQAEASSANHTENASPPLYSTVVLDQE